MEVLGPAGRQDLSVPKQPACGPVGKACKETLPRKVSQTTAHVAGFAIQSGGRFTQPSGTFLTVWGPAGKQDLRLFLKVTRSVLLSDDSEGPALKDANFATCPAMPDGMNSICRTFERPEDFPQPILRRAYRCTSVPLSPRRAFAAFSREAIMARPPADAKEEAA